MGETHRPRSHRLEARRKCLYGKGGRRYSQGGFGPPTLGALTPEGDLTLIVLEHVSRRFGEHVAVDDVSLTIAAGRIFGIIGPNGAGKSTLFRMICQLIHPDSGRIRVFNAHREIEIKRLIGYLPEEHRLYEHMKTRRYLEYFCDLQAVPRRRAMEVLERVELLDKADAKIAELSKGMRQKVGFARALITDPKVLILDEPTYGLDAHTSRHMRSWIAEEARRKVVVMSSHNLHEAERMCGRIAILHRGRVVAHDSPLALIERLKEEHILEVSFLGPDEPLRRAARSMKTIRPPVIENGRMRLFFSNDRDRFEVWQEVLGAIQARPEAIAITGIAPRLPTLEDVFLRVTGEHFEDAEADVGTDTGRGEGEASTHQSASA